MGTVDPTNHWSCPICIENFFPYHNIENSEDFVSAQIEMNNFNIDIANNVLFDPFDFNDDGGALDDIDPDGNYFNIHATHITENCKYKYPNQLTNEIKKINSNFSTMHLNIRSIKKNFTDLNTLLNNLDHPFSILGLTETWLKPYNTSLFDIKGYIHENLTRPSKIGGGVSIYINENLNYKTRPDLTYQDQNYEMLWIEIDKTNLLTTKKLCYRHHIP
jgi:hypothetical protein